MTPGSRHPLAIQQPHSLDTIFLETGNIPCKITLINSNNIFYSNSKKGEIIPIEKVIKLSLRNNFDGIILISDTSFVKAIFSGDTIFNKINEINLGNNIEKIKTFSQTEIDTLQFLLYELGEIKKDFNIFHNKYKVGSILLWSGIGFTLITIPSAYFIDNEPLLIIGCVTGGVLTLVGSFIQLDAILNLGRTTVSATPNGFTIKQKF
jgi:hypothetical protein